MEDTQLVAFYVSKTNAKKQVKIYSSYLEKIMDDTERREALKLAERCGLNIDVITKTVVENIKNKPIEMNEVSLQVSNDCDVNLFKSFFIDFL